MSLRLTGGCLCGDIRFVATSEPLGTLACHCADCQRYIGGGPAYQMTFRRDDVTIEKGEPRRFRKAGDSGHGLERSFCATCGAPLFTDLDKAPEFKIVNAGALDDQTHFNLKAHIFAASAPPWRRFEPDVRRYDGDYPRRPRGDAAAKG
jgi:hypothetical protein